MKHLSPAEIETIRVPEPKHDPFTLESLVAWLEKMPGEKHYCFFSQGHCLIASYLSSLGFRNVWVGGFTWYCDGRRRSKLPFEFRLVARELPHTFGAALTRARAALASQKGNANG
jgi:hypothetical protein